MSSVVSVTMLRITPRTARTAVALGPVLLTLLLLAVFAIVDPRIASLENLGGTLVGALIISRLPMPSRCSA